MRLLIFSRSRCCSAPMRRCASHSRRKNCATSSPPVSTAAPSWKPAMRDLFDPTSIQLLLEDLGESATREVLDLFFTDSAARLDQLREKGTSPDSRIAGRYARSLKNAATAFGFTGLAALAQ